MKSRLSSPPHPFLQQSIHRNKSSEALMFGGTPHRYSVEAVPENQQGDYLRPNAFRYEIERTVSLDGSRTETELSHGTYSPQATDYIQYLYWYGWPQLRPSAPQAQESDFDLPRQKALAKLYDKVRNNNGVNLAVDFAERTQVLGMLNGAKKFAGRLANGPPVDHRRKRMINGRPYVRSRGVWHPVPERQLAQMSASKYLEFTYGWQPLFNSIYGSFRNIMSGLTNGVVTLRGKGKEERRTPTWASTFGIPNAHLEDLYQCWRVLYQCQFDLTPNALLVLAQYTTLNPLLIAWERVPYSFVVDWFYNIGGYLETAETALLYANRFQGGFVTRTYRATLDTTVAGSGTFTNNLYPNSLWSRNIAAKGRSERKYLRREILYTYPFPSLPSLSVRLGARRMTNAAALIAQKVLHR